jgi:SAM-dependent methyltransferase
MSEVRFDASNFDPTLRRHSPWWGIHAARYQFALPHVAGCRVLDIACGTGYGLPVLQTRARWVVGVDIDVDTARKARSEIGSGPEAVVVADGCILPFSDASFDVITSFETLEHLERRAQFLAELRRVLTTGGLCIISTPNATYTRPVNGRPRNPHHVFEYTPAELIAELNNHFSTIELLGQVLGSHYVLSPFLEDQERLPRTVRAQTRLFLWRVINKAPAAVRDHLSRALWGHPLFPGDTDYTFSVATAEEASVLVALCSGLAVIE